MLLKYLFNALIELRLFSMNLILLIYKFFPCIQIIYMLYIYFFIDYDLPDIRSVYRDHEHLWKFYVDLERFKKGLIYQDYDYVIHILKEYTEKQDETPLFVRSCYNILRREVKRSEYHLANIINRTGNTYFNT